ncbi:MAG: ankyrin repeat domain-containing protein [Gammaproteobacteria bacterium]|jgi:ankyrin repeat protein|nr:ankyrin repeat domain-containing protein [Gammaproteobacteria bacterium]
MSLFGPLLSEITDRLFYKLSRLSRSQDDLEIIVKDIVMILEDKVDLNDVRNMFGQSIAHVCGMKGLTRILSGLVALCTEYGKPLNLLISHKEESYTPLHLACSRGHEDTAKFILQITHGEGAEVQDALGMTPAHLVVCCVLNVNARERLLALLQEHSADFLKKDLTQKTCLEIEKITSFNPVTYQNALTQNPLHFVNYTENFASSKMKTKHMIESCLNRGDAFLRTPLMYMAIRNCVEGTQFLCRLKANPTNADYQGRTSLHYAVFFASTELIQILLEADANSEQQDKFGITPAHIAKSLGRRDVTELFATFELEKLAQRMESSFYISLPTFMTNLFANCTVPTVDAQTNRIKKTT